MEDIMENIPNINLQDFPSRTQFHFHDLKVPKLKKGVVPVAIDIGYSQCKIFSPFGRHVFPSVPVEYDNDKATTRYRDTDIRYKDDKLGLWFVGDLATRTYESRKAFVQETKLYERDRIKTDEYLVLLRASIAIALLKEDYTLAKFDVLKIKTGLPEEYIKEDISILKDRFDGYHKFEIKIGGNEWITVKLDITASEDVLVITQPFGTIWSMGANHYGEETNEGILGADKVLVFDGGFHTIDTFYTLGGQQGTSFSSPKHAMYSVYKKTCDNIKAQTRNECNLKVFELNSKINHDIHPCKVVYSEKHKTYDFSTDLLKNLDEVAMNMLSELKYQYDNLIDVRYLLMTGGTGKAFYPIFRRNIPSDVQVLLAEVNDAENEVDNFDTVFSNVVGFFNCLVAELLYVLDFKEEEEEEEEKAALKEAAYTEIKAKNSKKTEEKASENTEMADLIERLPEETE